MSLSDPSGAIVIRRGAKRLTIDLSVRGAAAATGALTWEPAVQGFRLDGIAAGGWAAQAGLEAGDRVVRIDRSEPRSIDDVRRRLGDEKPPPMLIEVERDGRLIAILVT